MKSLTLLLVLSIGIIPVAARAMPIQWTSASGGNGHWYEYSNVQRNYSDALHDVEMRTYDGLDGQFVTINSQAELGFLMANGGNLAAQFGASNGYTAWTGGQRLAGYTDFLWREGRGAYTDTVSITNWLSGDPDVPFLEDAVISIRLENGINNGVWGDRSRVLADSSTNFYIIEYGNLPTRAVAAPVPLPASITMAVMGLLSLGALRKWCQAPRKCSFRARLSGLMLFKIAL